MIDNASAASRIKETLGIGTEPAAVFLIGPGGEPPEGLFATVSGHRYCLCVASWARSQLAEWIARTVAPLGVRVWSAGSNPRRVRPEAISVLREIGIDIPHHRTKAVEELPASEVDAVIRLCGEEKRPVFLGKATPLHSGLPDPAAVAGTDEQRVAAFRGTREELQRRISALFGALERTREVSE